MRGISPFFSPSYVDTNGVTQSRELSAPFVAVIIGRTYRAARIAVQDAILRSMVFRDSRYLLPKTSPAQSTTGIARKCFLFQQFNLTFHTRRQQRIMARLVSGRRF